MDKTKKKVNTRRLLITAGIILLTALVIGGTVWYIMDQNAKSIAESNKQSEEALQKQIDELNTKVTATTTKTTTTTSDNTTAWKTYTSNEKGFSFKYPDNYTVTGGQGEDYFALAIKSNDGSTETMSLTINGPGSSIGLMEESVTTYNATISNNKVTLVKAGTETSSEINNDYASIVSRFENSGTKYYLMSRFPITSDKAQTTEKAFTDIFGTLTFN